MSSTDRVTLEHEGMIYDPFAPDRSWWQWRETNPEESRRAIIEGTLMMPDYEEMDPKLAKRVKARLLRRYEGMPEPGFALPEDNGRWLVPDVWRWGHKPILSGQPRAGKSTLVVDLIASLLVPDHRFLDYYGAVELTDDERNRGVWLINAENPEPELRDAIQATSLSIVVGDTEGDGARYFPKDDAPGWLLVDHLRTLGGPSSFDLRDPAIYDMWVNRITDLTCTDCWGLDEAPPLAVIVDGLTAILGSDTTGYGEWNARFRDLMDELEVPSALVVAHSSMNGGEAMNGVESIAGADGSWKYEMKNVHDQKSPRTFSGSRRLIAGGINGGRVVLGTDGRLRIPRGSGGIDAVEAPEEPERRPGGYWAADVLDRLGKAGAAGLMTVGVTDSGKEGKLRRAALRQLAEAGRVVSVPEGKGARWFLSEAAPAA